MDIRRWEPFWRNELGARGCRATTIAYRLKALRSLTKFTAELGQVPLPSEVSSELLMQWRQDMQCNGGPRSPGYAPATINGYLAAVRAFLRWLASEGVISEAPRVRFVPERDEQGPPVFDLDELRKLARAAGTTTQGRSQFEAVRDSAVVALLQDSGLRASECAGLLVEHVDIGARQAFVHEAVAKGGRARTVTFGFQTARLLNRYALARTKHPYAFMPELFLGRQGPASYPLVRRIVRAAGERAGVEGARPHLLRHSWAHNLKDAGVSNETLMALGGWRSMEMPLRYGRAGREARAVDEYQRMGSPVDRRR